MTGERDPNRALHYSEGKPGVDQISAEALLEVGRVFAFGAEKYGKDNWLQGTQWSEFLGSALRHLLAWKRLENNDPESGLPHLAHAAWNCLALIHYQRYGLGEDDRPSRVSLSDPYVAGLIDGEGSIHISKSRGRSGRFQYSLHLSITNTDYTVLSQVSEKFGGGIYKPPMKGKLGSKTVYVWQASGSRAAEVLELLLSHLRIKKLEALEAIEFQKHQRSPGDNSQLTDAEMAQRENAYCALRELKKIPPLRDTEELEGEQSPTPTVTQPNYRLGGGPDDGSFAKHTMLDQTWHYERSNPDGCALCSILVEQSKGDDDDQTEQRQQ